MRPSSSSIILQAKVKQDIPVVLFMEDQYVTKLESYHPIFCEINAQISVEEKKEEAEGVTKGAHKCFNIPEVYWGIAALLLLNRAVEVITKQKRLRDVVI